MKNWKAGAFLMTLILATSSLTYAQDKGQNKDAAKPQKVEKAAGQNAPSKAASGTNQKLDAAVADLNDKLKLTPDQQKKIDDLIKASQSNVEKNAQSLAGDQKKFKDSVNKEVSSLASSVEKLLNETQ
ncbi:MAG: hypothetical protein RMM53_13730, partial [Bacteroidia bacterium]|nr:hypothetical protein [Bacteroidia bacterium]